jgi:hypothetical protein
VVAPNSKPIIPRAFLSAIVVPNYSKDYSGDYSRTNSKRFDLNQPAGVSLSLGKRGQTMAVPQLSGCDRDHN